MKKKSIQSVLIVLLTAISISSYVFLNTLSVPQAELDKSLNLDEVELNEISKSDASLPDVKIAELAIEFFKNLVPVSN